MKNVYSILLDDPIVCRCASVRKNKIIFEIKKNKCKTVSDVTKCCNACCCKSCHNDIIDLIQKQNRTLWQKIKDLIWQQ